MVYPFTALPLVVEIAPGGSPTGVMTGYAFSDVTSKVRVRDGVMISEGRSDWADEVDPGSCSLVFDNRTGDFSPYNPLGQWYGKLGKDTPLRVRIKRVQDDFQRTATFGFGTSTSGQVWEAQSGGFLVDRAVSAGVATVSLGTINQFYMDTIDVNLRDCEQSFSVATNVGLAGASMVTGAYFRWQDPNNYYWLRVEFDHDSTDVILKVSKTVAGVVTDLATLDPVPGLPYTPGAAIRAKCRVDGDLLSIKVWNPANPEPGVWTLTASDTDLLAPGKAGFGTWRLAGNTNVTTPVASYRDYKLHCDLFGGTVLNWPPRWDQSGKNRHVPVTARGILYRHKPATAKPPPRSPVWRAVMADPITKTYYPCEDGGDSTQAASAIQGHPPLATQGTVTFAELQVSTFGQNQAVGSFPLPDLKDGGRLVAPVAAEVTAACQTAGEWTVHLLFGMPSVAGAWVGDFEILDWLTPNGTFNRWRINMFLSGSVVNWTIKATNASTGVDTTVFSGAGQEFGSWRIMARQSGGNIACTLYPGSSTPIANSIAGTLSAPTQLSLNASQNTSSESVLAGHLIVWPTDTPSLPLPGGQNDIWGVEVGTPDLLPWQNEEATDRLSRLAAEDGIYAFIPPIGEASTFVNRMGPQPNATSIDLYNECVNTEQGVLYERPFSLGYAPRQYLLNQAPVLTLDAQDGFAEPPVPDPSNQKYRNRFEMKRKGGSSAIVDAPEVAEGAIIYPESQEASFYDDRPLPEQAAFRLGTLSDTGLRWTDLQLDLAARPELIDQWLNCRVGSRITATNPMADVAGRDIDVLLEGHTTTLWGESHKVWKVSMNCSAGAAWAAATVDGEPRVPSDGSSISGVTLGLADPSFLLQGKREEGWWTTDPADFPLDLVVGGEKIRLSSIAPLSDSYTRTASSSWGVSTTGQTWTSDLGLAASFAVNGAVGQHVHTVLDNIFRRITLTGPLVHDAEVLVDMSPSAAATGASVASGVLLRYLSDEYYWVRVDYVASSSAIALELVRRKAGVNTTLAIVNPVPGVTYAAGQFLRVRASIRGSRILAKVWNPSGSEPAGWQLLPQHDIDLPNAGRVGLQSWLPNTNTNALPFTFSFDNFAAYTILQVANVSARGLNGVTRTHVAGTPVDVWSPAIATM